MPEVPLGVFVLAQVLVHVADAHQAAGLGSGSLGAALHQAVPFQQGLQGVGEVPQLGIDGADVGQAGGLGLHLPQPLVNLQRLAQVLERIEVLTLGVVDPGQVVEGLGLGLRVLQLSG